MAMVEIVRRGRVGVILIDNPPVNALALPVRQGLLAAVREVASDASFDAAVIAAAGRTFIAGADLREMERAPEEPRLPEVVAAIAQCAKPVVAALHGTALGGGFEIALACRARLAKIGTVVGLPEVKVGVIPGAGGTQRLARFVGKAKAMDLCLTGRMMDAAEAERAGLVARVVPTEKLMDEAIAAAEAVAGHSLASVMVCKEAVNRSYETTLNEGVRFERRTFHALFATQDQKEGMAAFIEKRPPVWTGR
jgi:enoyl-CoA hydratase